MFVFLGWCFCVVCCKKLSMVAAFVCLFYCVIVFFRLLRLCLVFFVVKIVWCKRRLVSKVSGVKVSGVKGVWSKRVPGVKVVCCKKWLVSQVSSVEVVKGAWCKSVLL